MADWGDDGFDDEDPDFLAAIDHVVATHHASKLSQVP